MIRLEDVQRGFDAWAAKPHNAKWVRRIDGTPIPNDIVVCIFTALRETLCTLPEPFPQPRRRDGAAPCGECHMQPGETCDICGAVADEPNGDAP